MKRFVIIVAGGSGTRMGGAISKQYLEIGGMPILMHTLSAFYNFDPLLNLFLVIPSQDFEFWGNFCQKFAFKVPHVLVAGGKSRFQSVKNGLDAIDENSGLVAIHDGVRPFVSGKVIFNCFEAAEKFGSGVAVISLKDSIRKITENGKSIFQERSHYRLVQTPQTFRLDQIKQAYQIPESELFTDDATVYEHQGWEVELIEGNPENIKITSPEDLDYADFLCRKEKK